MWLEDVDFTAGSGKEDGYRCYAKEGGKLVFLTDLQFSLFLTNDILVLLTIAISVVILWLSFEKEVKEARKAQENDELGRFRSYQMAYRTKLGLYKSTGWFVGSYVILRLPWMIFADTSAEEFGIGMRIAILLYFMKFSVLFFLFGYTNKNYRKAYSDFIKLICPCFCQKVGDEKGVNKQ
jgi:hypothetical protein